MKKRLPLTATQKQTVELLFEGCNIASCPTGTYRLRDAEHRPKMKLNGRTFNAIYKYLRKEKGLYILNKNAVRQEHGKSWIKQFYKQSKEAK